MPLVRDVSIVVSNSAFDFLGKELPVNEDTRWVVRAFLDDQGRIDVRKDPPLHIIAFRLALVDMVLTEVETDDLECLALRAVGETTRDLYMTPPRTRARVDAIEAWLSARRAHLEVIKAAYGEK